MKRIGLIPERILSALAVLSVALLSACAAPTPGAQTSGAVYDPYEETNRKIHGFNVALDKAFVRSASKGYTTVVPEPMLDSVTYFSDNLSMPSAFVNSLLQGNFKRAGTAALRFALNSTIGFAGLADPATDFGIPPADTDFGETLHVWGFGEGPFVMLPIYGPSTSRDAIGVVTDLFTNPLSYAPQRPIKNIGVWARALDQMGNRGRYSDVVDSILYDSADSYAQLRTIYLQNRRFELGETDAASEIDPYALDTEGF
ncbi:MlaA family lipoprotein [Jhaorihella thermophila]|uniref:Phospholipid-binding lipoprotein MlaA n=1 Tax=Jhaorihella thermophila TaxID=488547 RepID=A0A1H5YAA3_9RHOB|nr:phospholipid-binding lipoprotein MlaA [Jhaorihella thermophila]